MPRLPRFLPLALLWLLLPAASPALAPPPPQLAYVTGKGDADSVWLANADGSHGVLLGPGDDPVISPDRRFVAASRFAARGWALAVYDAGGGVHHFGDSRSLTASAASWSPDGRYLAAEVFASTPGRHDRVSGLVVIDTSSWSMKRVASGQLCGASFSPDLPARLAYALSRSQTACQPGRSDVWVSAADGSGRQRLTHDGNSVNPVWGAGLIVFDHERARRNDFPAFQLVTIHPDGTGRHQLTHTRVPQLVSGLSPVALSGDGERLLARFAGQDTNEAWKVDMRTGRARRLLIGGQPVTPYGISLDGSTVLVDRGDFLEPPNHGAVYALAYAGGQPHRLVAHAASPSWNR